MKTVYQHFYDKDIPLGGGWIERKHFRTNIEVLGPPRHGKTTLVEHIILGMLKNEPAGILHIDPTGDGYRRLLGWCAEGKINRPVWLVDVDEKPLRYNPLAVAKTEPEVHIPGLYEAFHLMQSSESPGQHRQMQKNVMATLHALTDNDLTLADSIRWLKMPSERTPARVARIRDEEARLEWEMEPSRNDLKSAENWFSIFAQEPLRSVFCSNGFSWDQVYDEQPVVLVNLGARKLSTSVQRRTAVAAMFIMGLFTTAFTTRQKKPWYVVIDDATHYTPPHIGRMLVESEGHHSLYFILMHHTPFDGGLQRMVDVGCRSKFFFGPHPNEREFGGLKPHQCGQFFNDSFVQWLNVPRSPEPPKDTKAFQEKRYAHAWYEVKPDREPPSGAASGSLRGKGPTSRPDGTEFNQKPFRPRPNKDRREQ